MLRTKLNLLLIALLLTAAGAADAGSLSVVGQSRWVEVGRVIDGDTFHTKSGEKVRLLGINTPEIAHDSSPAQPYGIDAKRQLEQLISGKTVRLQLDRDRKDNYGRTLAQVFLRDGSWINALLVRQGLALVYTFAPNFQWAQQLLKEEALARNNMLGIWKSERFKVLDAGDVTAHLIGQFRLLRGRIKSSGPFRYQLGKVMVTIPRSARGWFTPAQMPHDGQQVIVRGRIRTSTGGGLFLALHSPFDLE
ncbi:thermonuclease family protein [Mariprofundus sp. KV]|uniref:thermonuclease family protein n=1 Tax=Mariprofundus sp. KV TaxID=2608715 RepID=UPI001888CC7F|nr:thermonuclease family protein [Mariprofundus sp. KV]